MPSTEENYDPNLSDGAGHHSGCIRFQLLLLRTSSSLEVNNISTIGLMLFSFLFTVTRAEEDNDNDLLGHIGGDTRIHDRWLLRNVNRAEVWTESNEYFVLSHSSTPQLRFPYCILFLKESIIYMWQFSLPWVRD